MSEPSREGATIQSIVVREWRSHLFSGYHQAMISYLGTGRMNLHILP